MLAVSDRSFPAHDQPSSMAIALNLSKSTVLPAPPKPREDDVLKNRRLFQEFGEVSLLLVSTCEVGRRVSSSGCVRIPVVAGLNHAASWGS